MYSQICTFSGELQRNRKALSTHSEHNSGTVNFIQLKVQPLTSMANKRQNRSSNFKN